MFRVQLENGRALRKNDLDLDGTAKDALDEPATIRVLGYLMQNWD